MKYRIFPQKSIKLIMITIFLLLFISMPAHATLWGNKIDINTQDFRRIITELCIYDDPDLPYYNEIFRFYYSGYTGSEELLDALNNKIEITQQVMKTLDGAVKKDELGNLTYGRYILNAIEEKGLLEMGIKLGSPGQANGEYFNKLGKNLANWKSQLSKFLLKKIVEATCTAMGAPALSIGISTLGLFTDLSIIGTSINKLNEVWYEKAFWSYMQFRNEPNNYDHIGAWKPYAEPYVNYIIILSLEKQKKARKAIEENFESLWNKYGDHIVNNELDKNFKSQQRESLKILLLYALGAEPHPVITSPLKITPVPPYYTGDTINAEFTITNQGKLPINFSVLTVGGRDPDNRVADFSHRENITLEPSESYNYQGTLTLNKVRDYHFFCTYQTPDGNWNTCIDLGSGLTDEDRTEDISVIKVVEDKIEKEEPFKTFYYKDNHAEYSVKYPNWPISREYEEDESFGIIKSFEINHKNEMKIAISIIKESPETYQNKVKYTMGSPVYTTIDYFRLNFEEQLNRLGQSKKIRDFTKYDQDFLEWTIDGESYFLKPIQKQIGLTDLKLHCLSKILYCDNYNVFAVTIYVNESKWLKYKKYSKTIIDSMTIRTKNSPSLAFGTVLIDLARYELRKYEVYLDSPFNLIGATDKYGELLLQGVPVGGHNFFAGNGQTYQYIHVGFNVVVIYVRSFTKKELFYTTADDYRIFL